MNIKQYFIILTHEDSMSIKQYFTILTQALVSNQIQNFKMNCLPSVKVFHARFLFLLKKSLSYCKHAHYRDFSFYGILLFSFDFQRAMCAACPRSPGCAKRTCLASTTTVRARSASSSYTADVWATRTGFLLRVHAIKFVQVNM